VNGNAAAPPASSLVIFARILAIVSGVLVVGGLIWQGIDFALGVLLGCGIVGLNFWWTRRVIAKALRGDHAKARLWISFLAKFGFTVVILFVAILHLNINPVGILVGVSSLVVTGFAFAFVRFGQ